MPDRARAAGVVGVCRARPGNRPPGPARGSPRPTGPRPVPRAAGRRHSLHLPAARGTGRGPVGRGLPRAVRALAKAEGVERDLLSEWALSQPGLAERWERAARSAAGKGWPWAAEMEEIATAMASAGLPDGFHQAAAEIFRDPAAAAAWSLQLVRAHPQG